MTASPTLPHSTLSHASSPPKTKPWRETPIFESATLSRSAGCRILLKLELLQPSGSFKIRGLGNLVLKAQQTSPQPTKTHFFSSSGGNAGLAAVLSAQFVQRPCTVVVPLSTKPFMIQKIRDAGASEVIQEGKSWRECDEFMREVVMKEAEARGEVVVYVPPFDHPDVWEGHASIVDEVREQMGGEVPDWVVCSAGGGGLFCGVVEGVKKQGREWAEKAKVLVVETEGADALDQSLKAGEQVTLPGITSIATSLGAVRVGDRTWELASEGIKDGSVKNVVLSDAEAAMGCWKLLDDENLLVEAACGVNTALCYGERLEKAIGRKPRPDEKVVIVVCGGSNISLETIKEWKREYVHLL